MSNRSNIAVTIITPPRDDEAIGHLRFTQVSGPTANVKWAFGEGKIIVTCEAYEHPLHEDFVDWLLKSGHVIIDSSWFNLVRYVSVFYADRVIKREFNLEALLLRDHDDNSLDSAEAADLQAAALHMPDDVPHRDRVLSVLLSDSAAAVFNNEWLVRALHDLKLKKALARLK